MSQWMPAVANEPVVHASGASRSMLDDGRWHFQHGPIDIIVGVEGDTEAVEGALADSWERFTQILPELVTELPLLRARAQANSTVHGAIANRMLDACRPYMDRVFATPMAAVAGSVAEDLIRFFVPRKGIRRAYVNNGGDIALHVAAGECYRVGLFSDLGRYQGQNIELDGTFEISADLPVRGIATSGWRGRSQSLGIADSVTVLASSAAVADVAATLIANHVNVDHVGIHRAPADTLKDDTDLGSLLVTVQVDALPRPAIDFALDAGAEFARHLHSQKLIHSAVLMLQGSVRVVGEVGEPTHQEPPGTAPRLDFQLVAEPQGSAENKVHKDSHV